MAARALPCSPNHRPVLLNPFHPSKSGVGTNFNISTALNSSILSDFLVTKSIVTERRRHLVRSRVSRHKYTVNNNNNGNNKNSYLRWSFSSLDITIISSSQSHSVLLKCNDDTDEFLFLLCAMAFSVNIPRLKALQDKLTMIKVSTPSF